MIRGLVAIDSQRGMADEHNIPWDIPGDRRFFVEQLQTGLVLMGYGTYLMLHQPFGLKANYVATRRHKKLKSGFLAVSNARTFLAKNKNKQIWNIGGANLLATTIDLLDELYITQLVGNFGTTKFLPEYQDKFSLVSESEPQHENGITYTYQVWRRTCR